MNDSCTINIGKDYTDLPYGRDERDGEYNGKHFRKTVLIPKLRVCDRVVIIMGDALGYGSSFLDEAFAGLIKYEGFSKSEILQKIDFQYHKKSVIQNIYNYMDEAEANKK